MFWQMVKGALIRQRGRFILIALTVALGVSLATAMLNVMFDIGEKVNQELKAFGANITVTPRNSMVLKDLYGVKPRRVHIVNTLKNRISATSRQFSGRTTSSHLHHH